ncbi:MAG: porphobilinogen synthase [Bdellovibrionales bacterium]|nr:porphobilinogen synthase [Bdellovibrionales bacterium]
MQQINRPRRLRSTASIRDMVAETSLEGVILSIQFLFAKARNQTQPIATMPGQLRLSLDELIKRIPGWQSCGLTSFALFPKIPDSLKNSRASECLNPNRFLPQTIQRLKDKFPDITLITDVALDPYSSDGHDGIVSKGEILNDETVEILAQMAVVQAQAGADFVAPSDMMDGRVRAIRKALDSASLQKTGILAYSAKYASAFYGPFRDALESAPRHGDKKTYQMDPRNSREALREVKLDLHEGADMVMVKPALSYLDVIAKVKQISTVPVAAYNVSGEYSMVKAAASLGMIDETKVMVEILTSIRRAGADVILTYHAPEMAGWLRSSGS